MGFAERFAGGASSAGHSLRDMLVSASRSRSRSALSLRSEIYCRLMEKWVEWEDSSDRQEEVVGAMGPGCLRSPQFPFLHPAAAQGTPTSPESPWGMRGLG